MSYNQRYVSSINVLDQFMFHIGMNKIACKKTNGYTAKINFTSKRVWCTDTGNSGRRNMDVYLTKKERRCGP
jgi:hypothetical protein